MMDMEKIDIIKEVEQYAEAAGLSPSTVCVRAAGNSRLLSRIKRRVEQMEADEVRLKAYMENNPVGGAVQ